MWRIALLAVLALSLSACASHGYGPHPRHGYYYQTQPYGTIRPPSRVTTPRRVKSGWRRRRATTHRRDWTTNCW